MVAPLAFVIDVDALFALAAGFDHRPVGVDDRFLEEGRRLLAPHLPPRGVEDLHQHVDRGEVEAPAEVARRGRVGNPPRAQGVQIRLVITPQFQVLQAGAAGQ